MRRYDYVIVGAGSAGRTAAETLRRETPDTRLLLIDTEPVLPYKRTGVSKNVAGGILPNQLAVHDETWYSSRNIDLMTGTTARNLKPESRSLTVDDDESVTFSGILLALGARPRLPFTDRSTDRWCFLWTEDHGRILHSALRGSLSGRRRVAIVGMGVLGVEAAWQAKQLGAEVSIVGKSDRPMAHYLDPLTAAILTETLRSCGINLLFNRRVSGLTVSERQAESVVLNVEADNAKLDADYVVVAAGSDPEVSLAESAGLRVNRGIVVDSALRTSYPGIWAAGDCAEHPDGQVTGIWRAAEHQGKLAALSMLGRPVMNENPPYRLKCELFGGYWFSAGRGDDFEEAEVWHFGENLWRPRFTDRRLVSLTGALPGGLDKRDAKAAQALVLEGATRENVESTLRSLG